MSSLARNAATLISGNMIARLITLGLAPIVTRIFAPEAFGEFSAVLAVAMVLGAICHLRYPGALFLPREQEDVDALALLSLLLATGSTLIFSLALWAGYDTFATRLGIADHPQLLWLAPPVMLLSGWLFLFMQLAARDARFHGLAGARIAQAVGNRGVGISLGLAGMTTGIGLLWGRVAALICALSVMLGSLGKERVLRIFGPTSLSRIRTVAVRYKHFPLYSGASLLHQGTVQLPVILLLAFFSPAVAGLYALSLRILREPLNLFGEALTQVFTNRSSELQRNREELSEFTRSFMDSILKTALVPLALLSVVSVETFALIFGEPWRETGIFVTLLSPHYALVLLAWPLSALFDILERLRARFFFDLAYFAATMTGLCIGGLFANPVLAVGLFSLSSGLITLARILWLTRLSGMLTTEFLALAARHTLVALVVSAPAIIVKLLGGPTLVLLGTATASATSYYLLLYRTDKDFASAIMAAISKKK